MFSMIYYYLLFYCIFPQLTAVGVPIVKSHNKRTF